MDHKDSQQFLEHAEINSRFDHYYTDQFEIDADMQSGFADEDADGRRGPSLPIILISAASGIAAGVLGLYVAYIVLDLSVQLSAAVATLSLCVALGISGSFFSSLTGSRAAIGNIALSCGVVLLVTIFFSLCTLTGAIFASLILTW